jgi:glycosyltransferase involved in cell wall biosynthesis
MTREAAGLLPDCLAGVPGAGEVLVVDTGSEDDTVEVARRSGARVETLPWADFGPTREAAFKMATRSWIFWLDADERITPRLWEAIGAEVGRSDAPDGFLVDRRANFLGRWMRGGGWGRDRVLRLFRADRWRMNASRVHEHVEVTGPLGHLAGELLHLTDPDLTHYLAKFDHYTSLAAEDLNERGRRARWSDLLLRPPATFVRMYLLKGGLVDGWEGFTLAMLSAGYVYVKYAKLRELWNRDRYGNVH